jgi:chromosome segregation protein
MHLSEQQNRLMENAALHLQDKETENEKLQLLDEKTALQKSNNLQKETAAAALSEKLSQESVRLKERQSRLEDRKAGIIETLNETASLNARHERIQALEDSAADRFNQLIAEKEMLAKEIKAANINIQELTVMRDTVSGSIDTNAQEIANAEAHHLKIDSEIKKLDEQIYQAIQERDQSLHRKDTLINMEKSFEGFQRGVKNVLRVTQQRPQLLEGFHGVVADLIRVPKGYELAVETALGPALQHLVTEEESQAKVIIDYLKKHQQGRVTILPINVIKGRALRDTELRVLEQYPDASCALDRVSFPSPYRKIFENLLGRVVIVRQLETGIHLARELHHQVKITTLDGDFDSDWRFNDRRQLFCQPGWLACQKT